MCIRDSINAEYMGKLNQTMDTIPLEPVEMQDDPGVVLAKSFTSIMSRPDYMVMFSQNSCAVLAMESCIQKLELNMENDSSTLLLDICLPAPIYGHFHKLGDHHLIVLLLSLIHI
eukprot:TRINITY_DN28934_c0_g2_i2.p1 TRINITY_DN28934_c0_g2~~TRINITY_DN28934_c0_g2_i2.p1  ORF type:complete len:134 (+),score=32.94 TRINITY_DN28934_c0_g2_i2:60-404(+)